MNPLSAMDADSQEEANDAAFFSPSQHPFSSPIDVFGSPSLLAQLPPSDRTLRSQSSSNLPRLQLVSSSVVSVSADTRRGNSMPTRPSMTEDEEVDELDEFADQMAVDLDCKFAVSLGGSTIVERRTDRDATLELLVEVCDRLEAESLGSIMQRRDQMSSATQTGGSVPTPSQKRPRPSSVGPRARDVIDLRETSPVPASQPNKRAKQSDTLADADRPIKPYFQEDFVREALAKSKGVRPASPPEPSHISDPRVQKPPTILTPRQVSQPIIGSSNTVQSAPQPQPTNRGGGSSSRTVVSDDHANSNSTGSSSSDGDLPLAAITNYSMKAFEASAEVLTAIFQMDEAVAKLKTAYEGEVQRMQAELVERDVLIDGLRARLRRKGSK